MNRQCQSFISIFILFVQIKVARKLSASSSRTLGCLLISVFKWREKPNHQSYSSHKYLAFVRNQKLDTVKKKLHGTHIYQIFLCPSTAVSLTASGWLCQERTVHSVQKCQLITFILILLPLQECCLYCFYGSILMPSLHSQLLSVKILALNFIGNKLQFQLIILHNMIG